jgi:cyclopropane fatty-acyl-phospholipid synthase-like methyltransferase
MTAQYDRDYFENGVASGKSLYEDYHWMPEETFQMAKEILRVNKVELKLGNQPLVLDYGCAKGYLVRALRQLGANAFGVDLSDYALSQAPEDVANYLGKPTDLDDLYDGVTWDLVIAKDVLEHMSVIEARQFVAKMRERCRKMFVIVPLGRDDKYIIPEYEKDVTHVIREDLFWWASLFHDYGYEVLSSYSCGSLKKRWVDVSETGNGFIRAIAK